MTTLIKNAQIVDGTGRSPFKSDIYIKNDRIAAIGDLGRQTAERTINAAGLFASPGFIDVNTDSDHYLTLFTNPEQQDFLFQGVTTIFGGLCGSSLAPLLYGELLSIRKWAGDTTKINIDWKTIKEFLGALERVRLGVNFGTLIGHGTIRRSLLGEYSRDLTDSELAVFEKIIIDGLKDGAFGLSTGLSYAHSKATPVYEIKRLINILSRKKGIYATHLRSDSTDLLKSIQETIDTVREPGVTAIISHHRPIKGFEAAYEAGLKLIEENSVGANIYFDLYPDDVSHLAIYLLLPEWAREGNFESMLRVLRNESSAQKILSEMPQRNGDDIIVASAFKNEYLVGKSVNDFAGKRNLPSNEALLEIMRITEMKCTVAYRNIDYPLALKALNHPQSLVSSNSESSPAGNYKLERGTKTFTKFLDLSVKEKMLPLSEAILKITSKPAAIMGLKNRGIIKEGYKADVNIFSADQGQGASIVNVFVNGTAAVLNKKLEGIRAGEVLRKGT